MIPPGEWGRSGRLVQEWRVCSTVGILLLMVQSGACRGAPPTNDRMLSRPTMTAQHSGTSVLLQAVSAVDSLVVWVGGHGTTYGRSLDGGATWETGVVPGPDTLQFRDVYAVSADTAYLLSAGPGEMSRIYKTADGGRTWTMQFVNNEPRAFFDCFDFWNGTRGLAMSDAVDDYLVLLATSDGGGTWSSLAAANTPRALQGEGGFAASGTCVVTQPEGHAWIGTGAGRIPRVFRTADWGETWSVVETPVVGGTGTAGIMSLVFRDVQHGMALGGELTDTLLSRDNVAVTDDGGRTWRLVASPSFPGAVYGAAYVPGSPPGTVVAVGPGGAAYTGDDGATWYLLDAVSRWSVDFASSVGWAVGPRGTITRISFVTATGEGS